MSENNSSFKKSTMPAEEVTENIIYKTKNADVSIVPRVLILLFAPPAIISVVVLLTVGIGNIIDNVASALTVIPIIVIALVTLFGRINRARSYISRGNSGKYDKERDVRFKGQMVIGEITKVIIVERQEEGNDYFYRIKYKNPDNGEDIFFKTPCLDGDPYIRDVDLPLKVKMYISKEADGEHIYADQIINPPVEKMKKGARSDKILVGAAAGIMIIGLFATLLSKNPVFFALIMVGMVTISVISQIRNRK